jgi:heat-inducible transcriptional repressor
VEFANEHWFRLAATTLASATHAAGIATPAKPSASRVRRIDLVAINERLVSLILVLREGTVKQVLLNLDEATDQRSLNAIANRLNHEVADLTAAGLERILMRMRTAPAPDPLAIRVAERIQRSMQEFDGAAIEEVFSDGLLNVMAAPEFAQSEKLRRVFAALENRVVLGGLVGRVAGGAGVHVFIGEENPAADMREVSLVLAPYGRPGHAVGVVGVLGPTRMSYPQAIGTVGFVSGLMNELVEHLYA